MDSGTAIVKTCLPPIKITGVFIPFFFFSSFNSVLTFFPLPYSSTIFPSIPKAPGATPHRQCARRPIEIAIVASLPVAR